MNRSLQMIAVQYKMANYPNKTEQIKMSFIQCLTSEPVYS